ncbi:uncharacterized protein EV422DRAFT_513275 [Fimicolochytrium jonesii]|uniref:uncharacterized protein n=1 Tax=Fimicolochytrium jonesii TaxID=1396493 RepID=UPI0022FE13D6|nr:uncharacterized protein EV422DRAFT_513275 [Fimicolochytrium jonesii]KAI8827282.1 hypothetical protein EV422DRAFT_513275 [Fimicolochytrium jonesii]
MRSAIVILTALTTLAVPVLSYPNPHLYELSHLFRRFEAVAITDHPTHAHTGTATTASASATSTTTSPPNPLLSHPCDPSTDIWACYDTAFMACTFTDQKWVLQATCKGECLEDETVRPFCFRNSLVGVPTAGNLTRGSATGTRTMSAARATGTSVKVGMREMGDV